MASGALVLRKLKDVGVKKASQTIEEQNAKCKCSGQHATQTILTDALKESKTEAVNAKIDRTDANSAEETTVGVKKAGQTREEQTAEYKATIDEKMKQLHGECKDKFQENASTVDEKIKRIGPFKLRLIQRQVARGVVQIEGVEPEIVRAIKHAQDKEKDALLTAAAVRWAAQKLLMDPYYFTQGVACREVEDYESLEEARAQMKIDELAANMEDGDEWTCKREAANMEDGAAKLKFDMMREELANLRKKSCKALRAKSLAQTRADRLRLKRQVKKCFYIQNKREKRENWMAGRCHQRVMEARHISMIKAAQMKHLRPRIYATRLAKKVQRPHLVRFSVRLLPH